MPLNHTSKYTELTDNQFVLIGKLTIEFSNIEFLLGEVISRLLITPSFLGRTYTERMNVTALMEKIKNALDIHERRYGFSIVSEESCKLIKNILSEVEKVRLIRNKFAHYCWSRKTDEEIFGTEFFSKQPKINKPFEGSIIITNKEMEQFYKKAYEIVGDLERILESLPELLEDSNLKSKLS